MFGDGIKKTGGPWSLGDCNPKSIYLEKSSNEVCGIYVQVNMFRTWM